MCLRRACRHDHEARKAKRYADELAAARAAGQAAMGEAAALKIWKGRCAGRRACGGCRLRAAALVTRVSCVFHACRGLPAWGGCKGCVRQGVRGKGVDGRAVGGGRAAEWGVCWMAGHVPTCALRCTATRRLEERAENAEGLALASRASAYDGSKALAKEKAAHKRTQGERACACACACAPAGGLRGPCTTPAGVGGGAHNGCVLD